jgi:hypothetical protein
MFLIYPQTLQKANKLQGQRSLRDSVLKETYLGFRIQVCRISWDA